MPRFDTLAEWLEWQEQLHPSTIDLGLERVHRVAERLGVTSPAYGVITVAGTNGKGSSVAQLESILTAADYRVGSYTSPHLQRYNERIRIAGTEVSDTALCAAFQQVDDARGTETLTYFEFGTLAALCLFDQAAPDLVVLEVGMGGRLDAVNIMQPDVALVTSIGIDHSAWLGDDREAIGREKAGIFRADRPAVCSDPAPPASLEQAAVAVGARWLCLGRQFHYRQHGSSWDWHGIERNYPDLPLPALAGEHQLQNAAGVLMVLETLQERWPVEHRAIEQGLRDVVLPARCQVLPGRVERIFDVAHNPDSATQLLQLLQVRPCRGRTRLVLAMLEDKDAGEFARILAPAVDDWYLAGLDMERGLSASALREQLQRAGVAANSHCYGDVCTACGEAGAAAADGDRIVVCGSFHTVAEALACPV